MMNQNSLSYSDNDSAELVLDDSIRNLVAPNMKGTVEVKFDGYGTLHVMERGEDGKLLRDSCFIKAQDDSELKVSESYTNTDRLNSIMKKNATLKVCLTIQKVFLVVFMVFFIALIVILKITLNRIM